MDLTVGTYNLHGLNQGRPLLEDLCKSCDIIFVQEHWLLPTDLDKLVKISNQYTCVSSSAMEDIIGRGVLRGRPFGGVAVLVDNSLAHSLKILMKMERLIAVQLKNCLLINVYFPTVSNNAYIDILSELIGAVEDIIDDNLDCDVIFGGDFNLEFVNGLSCCPTFNNFINSAKLNICDDKVIGPTKFTYLSGANNHSTSFIDHFFISDGLIDLVKSSEIIDSGINLSDHLPLLLHLSGCLLDAGNTEYLDIQSRHSMQQKRLRWDKADLKSYYDATNTYLSSVSLPASFRTCSVGCTCESGSSIDAMYNVIAFSLRQAADEYCPKTSASFYKHYWDDELSDLKKKSIDAHDLWKSCGRPGQGAVYDIKRRAKAEYKSAIRKKKSVEDANISNDLHDFLLSKDTTAFWKTWECKFKSRRKSPPTVDGCRQHGDIANIFANNFQNACRPNNAECHEKLKDQFLTEYMDYDPGSTFSPVTVELIDLCMRKMKRGKAAGLDGIETEHLIHAHPRLCVLLSLLFNHMLMHGKVPSSFGLGVIVPIVKGAALDNSLSDNYRGITLSSNISKLFELCLLELYGKYLTTSDLQFGFKKGTGCSHALFVTRSVIEYFCEHGSSVNLCALDMSKAFDKVNHFALFIKLIDRNVPREFLSTLINWYSLCAAFVRWENVLSGAVTLQCGVRQGGVLSPVLFSVYVNEVIMKLCDSGHGCRIGDMFLGCVMYADDLILISASLCDLQAMVNICSSELDKIDMKINSKKSQVIRFGNSYRKLCKNITINGTEICCVDKLKYLGCSFVAAKSIKVGLHDMRIKFYKSFNSLYSKCSKFGEPVLLHLVNSHCLPFLLYGLEAMNLSSSELSSLDYTYGSAICRIFKTCYSNVKSICQYTCVPSVTENWLTRRMRFWKKCSLHDNSCVKFVHSLHSMLMTCDA